MNTKNILLISAVSLLGLSACGKWLQDPLSGKDKRFRDGLSKPTLPDYSKPVKSDAVRFLTPSNISLEEGVPAEFEISGRVLIDDYAEATVEFENLKDFPGAKYDAKTAKFSWTPPRGFVDSTKAGTPYADVVLNLQGVAKPTAPKLPVVVGTKELVIRVSRDFAAPEVTRVEKTDLFVREGTTALIQVFVRDRDANPADISTYPRVILQSINATKSMASLLSISRTDSVGNGEFRIYMQIDAREVELTGGIDNFKVGLIAASRYGKLSPLRIFEMDFYTSFATPTTTWVEELVATETVPAVQKFIIVDPKQEATLNVDRTFNLPAGSTMNCINTNPATLNCTFTWTPPVGAANTVVDIQANIISRNKDARDPNRPSKTLTFRTRVLPKGP